MPRESLASVNMEAPRPSSSLEAPRSIAPRMQYRSRPVTVAVDPVSLVISECISITSAIQKHARSPHSSVSAILGGSPNPIHLGPPSPSPRGRSKSPSEGLGGDGAHDASLTNRWGLRGQKGKSMQDNPMIAGFGKLRHELAGIKGNVCHSLTGAHWLTFPSLCYRYPIFRRSFDTRTVPTRHSSKGYRCSNHDPCSGRSTKVPCLWLHLPRVSAVRVSNAVSIGCRNALPVRH